LELCVLAWEKGGNWDTVVSCLWSLTFEHSLGTVGR
jgi:hypothetical protein